METLMDYLEDSIGKVINVDTKKIAIEVSEEETLNRLKINDMTIMSGNNADEKLIGIITKVTKKRIDFDENEDEQEEEWNCSANICNVTLVGSFYIKLGIKKRNIFKR